MYKEEINAMDSVVSVVSEDKSKILRYAEDRFFRDGFYKLSMDEIARDLAMSKSTLYKHFLSKLDLVSAVIHLLAKSVKRRINSVIGLDTNAVEKFIEIMKILTDTITRFSDKWMNDIQHHAPQIWMEIDEIRKQLLYETISKIILQGQEEKHFRPYPPELIITLFTGAIRNVVNPKFLIAHSFSYDEAVHYSFRIMLNGILTEKGQIVLNKLNLPK